MYIASGRTGRAGREGKAFNLVVGKEVYKLREIQRYCKTRIIPQAIPSLDDVTSIKAEKILDQVGEVLQDSDLSKVIDIVEKRVLEEDYTTLDLAAALLKMMMGEEGEELLEENRPLRELEDLEDESRRSRGGRNGRGSRGRNEDVARLFINIGKNQGIRRAISLARSLENPVCRDAWLEASICSITTPSLRCRESMRMLCCRRCAVRRSRVRTCIWRRRTGSK